MSEPDKESIKETRRTEKRTADDIKQAARDLARKNDTMAREKAIKEDQQAREARRAEIRVAEEIKQSARDQARRNDTLAREQANSEAEKARKLKTQR